MKWDLTIKADDWLIAFWWAEIAPGLLDSLPDGGYRLALARLLVAGSARTPPAWIVEDCLRTADGRSWQRSQSFFVSTAKELFAHMATRQAYYAQTLGCPVGTVEIWGDAAKAAELLRGGNAVPAWMRVAVFEHAPGTKVSP